MAPVIEVSGLLKRYGGRAVVDGLSFTVERGEVFALLGPNGAGKTTTVEILEGLRRRDGGSVAVLGVDPGRHLRRIAGRIGVMPQDGGLYAALRPPEALRLFAAFYDDPLDPEELLRLVGLEHARHTPWRRLSGGERQRLSLALALVGRPELAFLDEPTAGMDVHARATAWEVVRGLRERGTTVLLTTNRIEEAERLADRVAIVHRGRLRALGPPRELVSGAGQGIRFRARPGLDVSELGATEERAGEYVLAGAPPTPEAVARLTAWLAARGEAVSEIVVGARTLEEVFLELTRE